MLLFQLNKNEVNIVTCNVVCLLCGVCGYDKEQWNVVAKCDKDTCDACVYVNVSNKAANHVVAAHNAHWGDYV